MQRRLGWTRPARAFLFLLCVPAVVSACGGDDDEDDELEPVAAVEPVAPSPLPPPPTTVPMPAEPAVAPVAPVAVGEDAPAAAGRSGAAAAGNNQGTAGSTSASRPDRDTRSMTPNQQARLIEAARALGNQAEAQRLMRQFAEQHPNAPQAGPYRQLLERAGGAAPSPTPNDPPSDNSGGLRDPLQVFQ